MESATIKVKTAGGFYPIVIGKGCFTRLREMDASSRLIDARRKHILVSEPNVAQHHLATVQTSLARYGIEAHSLVIPAQEENKTLGQIEALCNRLLDQDLRRDSVIWGIGGGVLGDMAGFAASIVMRGLSYIGVPTTLLAQVDSSVGGKTGVNTRHGKNLIGTFTPPALVLAEQQFLTSLSDEQKRSGYGELVKHAIIADPELFSFLADGAGTKILTGDEDVLQKALFRSVSIKARIVAQDEYEGHERMYLNFGHTFGHALEAVTGYDSTVLPHGHAVVLGMLMAANLSQKIGACDMQTVTALRDHFSQMKFPVSLSQIKGTFKPSDVVEAMSFDKKRTQDGQTFVLLRGIGNVFTKVLDDRALIEDIVASCDVR